MPESAIFAVMKDAIVPVLTVSGSDSTSGAGIQADIRTISALGGMAHTVITAITAQNSRGISHIYDLPADMVEGQLRSVLKDMRPRAVKIGMVHQPAVMRALRDEIPSDIPVVCAPGILSSRGECLMTDVTDYVRYIFPLADVLVIKCSEAEVILGISIRSQEEMLAAASHLLAMGPKAVLLRGGHCADNLITGLLLDSAGTQSFFSSPNTEGWQIHGIGGTMSSAIAVRMALGDSVPKAISEAHRYIRCQVVYSVDSTSQSIRQMELYNRFMELIAANCRRRRDTSFYASELSVTPRYLAVITGRITGRSPKDLIADYLMQEIERALLSTSRSIQEISLDFGFVTQAALTKFFCSRKGCSPSRFRSGSQDKG